MVVDAPHPENETNKTLQSPFLWRNLKCPMCKEGQDHRVFRVRQFIPKTTEADQHVSEYKWMADNSQPAHPPYFALYYCKNCHFADIMADFRHGLISPSAHQLAKQYARLDGAQADTIKLLGVHTDYEHINFHSALNMHYLALHAQLTAPEDLHDYFKLGRLCLRIAWMYRERDQGVDIPDGPATCEGRPFHGYPDYQAFLAEVATYWPEIPRDEQAALRLAAKYFEEAISADTRFDEPKEYFAGVKLLMEILRRCNDHDHAYEVVRGIYNTGMDTRKRNSELLSKNDTSDRMRLKISAEEKIINKMMSEAAEMRNEILDRMVARDIEKARAIARAVPQANAAQLLTKLVAGGLRPEVVRRIVAMPEFKNGR